MDSSFQPAAGASDDHRSRAHHSERSGLVLSDNPRWIAGTEQAEAKYEVATTLRAKLPDGVWMYHRRIIGADTETCVDILAVTSTGVWVIEIEEVRGSAVRFKGRHGMLSSTYDSFLVNGQDYTEVLADIDRKAGRVGAALLQAGRAGPHVEQVLCLLGGDTASGVAARVRTCYLATLPQLVKLMRTKSNTLPPADVASIGLALGERFRRPLSRP